jgi:hypothetical protein
VNFQRIAVDDTGLPSQSSAKDAGIDPKASTATTVPILNTSDTVAYPLAFRGSNAGQFLSGFIGGEDLQFNDFRRLPQ